MGIKLLLADDSITIQKVVGIIFASEDYDVTIVGNGDDALAKAREIKPDVLLVDAVMPGKSGYEVSAQIRCDPVLQGLPILLLTGAFEAFDEDNARKSGVDDFISKPFESQNLIEKVTGLVQTGRQRAAAAPAAGPSVAPAPPLPPRAMEPPIISSQEAFAAIPPVPPPQPASGGKAESSPAQFTVEVMEGTLDDDLWGAFELDQMVDDQSYQPEVAAAGGEEVFVAEVLDEPFSFAEESEPVVQAADVRREWQPPALEGSAEAFEIIPEEEFSDFGAATLETASDDLFNVFAEETEPAPPTGPTEGVYTIEEEPSDLFGFDAEESALFAEPAGAPVKVPGLSSPFWRKRHRSGVRT